MNADAVSRDENRGHFKDEVLDRLADRGNVAQFVSFGPGKIPPLRFSRIARRHARLMSVEETIAALLEFSGEQSVNVRSFSPAQPQGHEFLYGLTRIEEAAAAVRRLAIAGLHTIVNETIDINDSGVSGAMVGGVIEFAPEDTPRAVEKPGSARLPRETALRMLKTVYGFEPKLDFSDDVRVEFSIHPRKRGVRQSHTVLWEAETVSPFIADREIGWPNRFSRFVGDKAYGLLVADSLGLPVPATTVIPRKIAPFHFGRSTGSGERWIRTCPVEQIPGRFVTARGWIDPFRLLSEEDPQGVSIASVLSQEGVDAAFSGATISTASGVVLEGVSGIGDAFMQGMVPQEKLPSRVVDDVRHMHSCAEETLRSARMEWVHDGASVWVVQLHRGAAASFGLTIYPGAPRKEHEFDVSEGLESLRAMTQTLKGTGDGIVLVGDVGITSHFGDVLRRAKIPSRLVSR